MAGINKVIIVGRMGSDPEFRTFNNGDQMCEFSVATSETWRDKQTGERKERTQWHSIKIMNSGLVKNVVEPFLRKGSLVGVEGELQNEQWEKNGEKRTKTKVVVGAYRGTVYLFGAKEEGGAGGAARSSSSAGGGGGQQAGSYEADLDDDIPF